MEGAEGHPGDVEVWTHRADCLLVLSGYTVSSVRTVWRG